ncbi:hypothetical protein RYX36_027516 [Vicia faba]
MAVGVASSTSRRLQIACRRENRRWECASIFLLLSKCLKLHPLLPFIDAKQNKIQCCGYSRYCKAIFKVYGDFIAVKNMPMILCIDFWCYDIKTFSNLEKLIRV